MPKEGSAPPNKKGGNGKGKGKKGKRATELTESQSEAGDNESAWSEVGDGDVPTRLSMFMFFNLKPSFNLEYLLTAVLTVICSVFPCHVFAEG